MAYSLHPFILAASCRKDDPVLLPSEATLVNPWELGYWRYIRIFFLLNEGNMGTNQASLDYDYDRRLAREIFYGLTPYEVKDPNDVRETTFKSHGDKLWAVINCSNYVEVMDVNTAKHITKIAIPNLPLPCIQR